MQNYNMIVSQGSIRMVLFPEKAQCWLIAVLVSMFEIINAHINMILGLLP